MINMNAGKPGGGTCGKGGKTMGLGKRAAALLCAAWIAVCCTGCDSLILGDTDALMRPPRPTGDKAGIHELLEQTAGANFTFKYPAGGDNRSAIIMQDLTGDGTQEAIALYEKEETSSTGVNIMFIHKQDGVWTSMGSFASAATQVDRVLFRRRERRFPAGGGCGLGQRPERREQRERLFAHAGGGRLAPHGGDEAGAELFAIARHGF